MSDSKHEIRIPSQKRSIAKKNAIIVVAKKMFLEQGYLAVNTNEIAKKADVAVGTLYSYFKDKREIFLQIMEECNSEYREICKKYRKELNINDEPRIVIERFDNMLMSALSVYGNLFTEYHKYVADSMEEKRKFFWEQNKIMYETIMYILDAWSDKLRITNREVAGLLILEWGFTITDLIAEQRNPVPPEVLKQEFFDAIERYLFP